MSRNRRPSIMMASIHIAKASDLDAELHNDFVHDHRRNLTVWFFQL